jgi:DNA-binding transcriptional ArsR family regulator
MFRRGDLVANTLPDPVICGKDDPMDHCDVHVVDPERVAAVGARLISPAVAGQMATVFKTLADQSRCRLMAAIIEAGELCVCDLAATVAMSESNVSHHLRVLRASGLVRARRAGKMVFYSPDDAHIRVLLDITREHVEHGPEDLSGEAVSSAVARPRGRKTAAAGGGAKR